MRLFKDGPDLTNEQLYTSLMKYAINGPEKVAMNFFSAYFLSGGSANHPQLGSLYDFAKFIESQWDVQARGINLISCLIRAKPPAQDAELENSCPSIF